MAKSNSIIDALDMIDPASFHGLIDDLLFASGLLKENLKHIMIDPTGWNPSKMRTIQSQPDSRLVFEKGCIFEYSTRRDWKRKLKEDVKSAKEWAIQENQKVNYFIFVTNQDIGNSKIENLTPEEYIKKELSCFSPEAFAIGQKSLLITLGNSDYFYIRRRWLDIPDDCFQSLEQFKQQHLKQAGAKHVYIERFEKPHWYDKNIEKITTFIEGNTKIMIIYSAGGIGKTRFVLQACEQIQTENRFQNLEFLFNKRRKSINISEIMHEISKDKESLIILDDAHLIENLVDFRNIISERDNAKIILITRSTAKENVRQNIVFPAKELELLPLDKESSINLLKSNLKFTVLDEYISILESLCEGNPLLIGISLHLINSRTIGSFSELKKHDLIESYLRQILSELKQNKSDISFTKSEPLLALIFLFRPLSTYDTKTRAFIRSIIGIDGIQEDFIIRDLEKNGVIERYGNDLWLYPDLLGEYLVESIFFPDTPILGFVSFFEKLPEKTKETVFKTLRELDNDKANLFLRNWAKDLHNNLESLNNEQRHDNLKKLDIISPIVPDEMFRIFGFLSNPENEKNPIKYQKPWFHIGISHDTILLKCLDTIDNSNFKYSYLNDSLDILLKLYFYKPRSRKFRVVREKAISAIANMASFNLKMWDRGCEYTIQQKILLKLIDWENRNLKKFLPIILKVCQELLCLELKGDYFDDPKIIFAWAPIVVTDNLVALRNDVMLLLQSVFYGIAGINDKIKVLNTLSCFANPHMRGEYGKELKDLISNNVNCLVDFYKSLIYQKPSALVLQEIEKQLYDIKRCDQRINLGEVNIEAVDELISYIQSDEFYQFYGYVIDKPFEQMFEGYKIPERDDFIDNIVEDIITENLNEWFGKFDKIAETYSPSRSFEFAPFNKLMNDIGVRKPDIAKSLIELSLSSRTHLKPFVRRIMNGIRQSKRKDIADEFANQWLESNDFQLVLDIPYTYWKAESKCIESADVLLFEKLLNFPVKSLQQMKQLDEEIMKYIAWIYRSNPSKSLHIIHRLFQRAGSDEIFYYVEDLYTAQRICLIDINTWDAGILHDIIFDLLKMPQLNYNNAADNILSLYGQKFPIRLVEFFEKRVEQQKLGKRGIKDRYDAIPSYIPNISEMLYSHPAYSQVISKIFNWLEKKDRVFSRSAMELIHSISPQIDDVLKENLLILIRSGNVQKMVDAIEILRGYRNIGITHDLLKEAVSQSKGNVGVKDAVHSFIVNGSASGERGLIESWLLEKDQCIRDFANDIMDDMRLHIEYREKRIKEEEIRRRKRI